MISLSGKSIKPIQFVSLPRTGHTSIYKALRGQGIKLEQGEADLKKLMKLGRGEIMRQRVGIKEWPKYFSMTIVRNSYDRAVSSWHWVRQKRGYDYYGNFRSFLEKLSAGIINKPLERWHTTVQLHHISDDNKRIIVDHIMRYDKLRQEYLALCKALGISKPAPLPKANKMRNKPYRSYYDRRCVKIVQRLYQEDIDFFKFTF